MMEININVNVTGIEGLVQAILALVGHAGMGAPAQQQAPAQEAPQQAPAQVQQQAPQQQTTANIPQQVPQQQPPVQAQTNIPQQAPAQTPPVNVPTAIPTAPPAPTAIPTAPAANAPQQAPGALPTATASPGYTLEQLQVAAAGLVSQGKGGQIAGILSQFGIPAMTELKPEQYGAFAYALRGAGAAI